MTSHHPILVIGGGTAGITVSAWLSNHEDTPPITLVEPSDKHWYQPLWTLVGGGVFPKEHTMREEADLIPRGVEWIRDRAARFDPDQNRVVLESGRELTYDVLVVATGIQLDFDKVKGLPEALGRDGVTSNYTYETAETTWKFLKELRQGRAIFTFPATPIKCGGAPQKIMWLADHWLRKQGRRQDTEVVFASAGAGIFGVPRYAETLRRLAEERDIVQHYRRNLVEVRPVSKEAVFEDLDGGDPLVLRYDLLHVTPPQSAPRIVRESALANAEGWVDVHKYTTQHVRYPNVFSIGDSSGLPTAKTGAAVRKQAPVAAANIRSFLAGEPLTATYDGYTSCPLVTGYGRLILAEFGYDGSILETFPFDQSRERYTMWALKAYGLPEMYWHGMLRGRM